jgi:hypothetical protein
LSRILFSFREVLTVSILAAGDYVEVSGIVNAVTAVIGAYGALKGIGATINIATTYRRAQDAIR